jgi:hypothetical protein
MILGPLSLLDASFNYWNNVSLSETGIALVSIDGGSTWATYNAAPLSAFDVLTPEPASVALVGLGLAAFAATRRRKARKN